MRPRGPRKPGGPGAAYKEMQRTTALRKQMDDERQRHRAAIHDLALQRLQAALRSNPADRAIELTRIAGKEAEENRKHASKMQALMKRIHTKP